MGAGQDDAGVEDESHRWPVVGVARNPPTGTSVPLTALIWGRGGLRRRRGRQGSVADAGGPVPPFCSRSRASCSWPAQ